MTPDENEQPRRSPAPRALLWVLIPLAAMVLAVLILFLGQVGVPPAGDKVAQAPAPVWKTLASDAVLRRIVVASCLHQGHPQPIWSDVSATKPQLMLMVGDNVYGDIRQDDPKALADAYAKQAKQPGVVEMRSKVPVLAIWDDHDYGLNDGGAEWRYKAVAADMFHTFWGLKPSRPLDQGIYYSRVYGPEGRRVQIIMLDTRSFRSALKPKTDTFEYWGKYEPDPDPTKTMLGAAQWAWLEAELKRPAEVRFIVSSIQVLAEGHGFERWGNLPAERERLIQLIRSTDAKGVVMLSGDRHMGALYRQEGGSYPLHELTASSLNRSYGPSRDARIAPLVSEPFHQENFGVLDIDWDAKAMTFALRGLSGREFTARRVAFGEIGLAD